MVSWFMLVDSSERILPPCSVLGCGVQSWAPSMEILERVQGRTTKKSKGLERLSDEERQRAGSGWRGESSRGPSVTRGGRVQRGQSHTQLCGAQCQGQVAQTEPHGFL